MSTGPTLHACDWCGGLNGCIQVGLGAAATARAGIVFNFSGIAGSYGSINPRQLPAMLDMMKLKLDRY